MLNTPWGISDSQQTLAPGIISHSTPSHGGIWLSSERQAQLPPGIDNFLHDLRWWEEDCDWVVPYILFADDIRKHGTAYKFEENLASAKIIARRYHPEVIEDISLLSGLAQSLANKASKPIAIEPAGIHAEPVS